MVLEKMLSDDGERVVRAVLDKAGKGDMIDIHVEAHADGICGDKEINFAGLIERHLCIACAWT